MSKYRKTRFKIVGNYQLIYIGNFGKLVYFGKNTRFCIFQCGFSSKMKSRYTDVLIFVSLLGIYLRFFENLFFLFSTSPNWLVNTTNPFLWILAVVLTTLVYQSSSRELPFYAVQLRLLKIPLKISPLPSSYNLHFHNIVHDFYLILATFLKVLDTKLRRQLADSLIWEIVLQLGSSWNYKYFW